MNTTENVITIEDLYFEYRSEEKETVIQVINGINMNIKRGEFLAVLGHNGSGKSTLAKHLNAILLPDSGKVTIDGICTADEDKLFDIR